MYFTDIKAAIEHVKSNTNILQIILEDTGATITNPNANENKFIFCPLHQETHKGSFCINEWYRSFRCYGACQESGDVVRWVQIWRGLSVVEAIEYLAAKYGIDITQYTRPPTAEDLRRDRYQEICDKVVNWCHTQFVNNKQLIGWYKGDTGFTDNQVDDYRIGYCPSVGELTNFLFKNVANLSKTDIDKLELDNPAQFTDSLIYPVLDLSGHVSRLYSKPLNPAPNTPYKYLGTSNAHPLFKKGMIFGLYQLRRSIRASGYRVLLCEGFKAAIAAGGVGVMGTHVADEQLQQMHDMGVRQIVTCFDGDFAGYTASVKCAEELARFKGIILKIAQLPIDTQCDTLVKASGYKALQDVVANAKVPIEFLISTRYDLTRELNLETRLQILHEVTPILARMSEIELDVTCEYLCYVLSTTKDAIASHVRDTRAQGSKLVNIKAEEAVLQQVMLDPACWAKLKTLLVTDEFFSVTDHQRIFTAIAKSYTQFGTSLTARVVVNTAQNLFPTEAAHLTRRTESIISNDIEYTFDAAAAIVVDLWRRRTAIKHATELQANMADVTQQPIDAINKFRRVSISTVGQNDNEAIEPIPVADRVMRTITERANSENKIIGHSFAKALPVLNSILSGIQERHQIIISANQGVGKSLLALNIVNPIAIDQRIPWLWIAQEMTEEELVMRLCSIRSGINNNRLQVGLFNTPDEYIAYRTALDDYAKGSLYIKRPQVGNIDEVLSICEEFKFKYGIRGVVWDYMQLVTPTRDQRGMTDTQILSEASVIMTNRVAGALGLASVCIAQLNRQDYKKGVVREAENIGGAYKIVQDATDVITLVEKTDKQIAEQGRERGNRIINVDKRRGGPSDILLNALLDKHDKISLKFSECVTPQEMIGFTSAMAA